MGVALYPLYIWVISGNTMRFGLNFFWGAVGIGLSGFSWVVFQNPYWRANLPLAISLLISIIVLPMFFAVLLKRLHYLKNKLHEEYLRAEYEANHDPLTKLPNRAQFEKRLHTEIKRSERHQLIFSILFIDLDGFKKINDQLGHRIGDLLLQQTAERMQSIIRTTDLLTRLGGDEFALVTALRN
ncbi:MAG: GGDEF domain-containing protein [Thiolinea sp.]